MGAGKRQRRARPARMESSSREAFIASFSQVRATAPVRRDTVPVAASDSGGTAPRAADLGAGRLDGRPQPDRRARAPKPRPAIREPPADSCRGLILP